MSLELLVTTVGYLFPNSANHNFFCVHTVIDDGHYKKKEVSNLN